MGIKHLIECHCYLALFKKNEKIINHKFPVYSMLDDFNNLIPKLVKCNNCEAVHHVSEISRSELRPGKDQSTVILSKKDLSVMLPIKIKNIFSETNTDISNYEHALDIIESKRWGESIVIERDILGEIEQVKIMTIHNRDNIKIQLEKIDNLAIKKGEY
jgi:hypothetical protein